MPYPNKLARLAAARDQSVEDMIAELLAEHETPFRVAAELGVYENSVRTWMKKHGGYTYQDGEWVRTDEAAHA